MTRRKYVSGTRWCVWRWTEVDSEYIRRLHVLKTPWFAVCLHWILKPDPEPHLHDHPVTFLSIVLRGGYEERRKRGVAPWAYEYHKWWNFIRATPQDRHTISHVRPGTLTLCFMGPKVREWGFHAPERWIYWKEYYETQRAEKQRQALSFALGNLATSTNHRPSRAAFVEYVQNKFGWTADEATAWADARKWEVA